MPDDKHWMQAALDAAREGLERGELPIGAVVVAGGEVIGRAYTAERKERRRLVHADWRALDEADRRLQNAEERRGATLYVTLEPCLGCLGAAMTVGVGRICFALESPGDGAVSFAQAWDERRDRGAFPGYRFPEVTQGVERGSSVRLFGEYVDRSPVDSPMTSWARTLSVL